MQWRWHASRARAGLEASIHTKLPMASTPKQLQMASYTTPCIVHVCALSTVKCITFSILWIVQVQYVIGRVYTLYSVFCILGTSHKSFDIAKPHTILADEV